MIGLMQKNLRESFALVAVTTLSLLVVASLLVRVLPELQHGVQQFLQATPFFNGVLSGILGVEVAGKLTDAMLMGLMWQDPVILFLVWGMAVALCSRYPAKEVERGTIDILLSWPVSRNAVYLVHSFCWMALGAVVCAAALTGFQLGKGELQQPPSFDALAMLAVNLFLTYLTVGAATSLVSACSSRQGPVVILVSGMLLASYLINFLAHFWDWMGKLAFLSLSSYYQPGQVLLHGRIPSTHLQTLLIFSGVVWSLSALVHARRDLSAAT